jgi:hypothetical protein
LRNGCVRGLYGMATHPLGVALVQAAGLFAEGTTLDEQAHLAR